jgi:hypothetical protein
VVHLQVLRVAKSNPEKLHEIINTLTNHCIKVSFEPRLHHTWDLPDVLLCCYFLQHSLLPCGQDSGSGPVAHPQHTAARITCRTFVLHTEG